MDEIGFALTFDSLHPGLSGRRCRTRLGNEFGSGLQSKDIIWVVAHSVGLETETQGDIC